MRPGWGQLLARHIPAHRASRPLPAATSRTVSAVTAVEAGFRADLGARTQARAREIEDELSRFCVDSSSRITVSARNYIVSRVFELGQLVEARREIAGLQRQALAAGRPLVGDVVGGGVTAITVGPAVRGVPGSGAAAGSTAAADLGAARGLTYAAVLSSGDPCAAGPPGSGPTGPGGAAGQRGSTAGETHEHVAFLTPTGRTESPARDVMRLLKSKIDSVAEDIRDVTLRSTRYGVTVFSHTRQSLANMQRALEDNSVTWATVSVRVPEKRRHHVKFSGVDPDVAAEDILRQLNERNPSLNLDMETCWVRVTLRERSGTKTHVAEVDAAAFRRIVASPRLTLGWTVVRVAEDLHVPSCTFCASYGHGRSTGPVAAEASRAVCPRCGAEGHVGTNCAARACGTAECSCQAVAGQPGLRLCHGVRLCPAAQAHGTHPRADRGNCGPLLLCERRGGCDFNAKHRAWGPRGGDERGARVMELVATLGLAVLNEPLSPPTYETAYAISWIDVTLATPEVVAAGCAWEVQEDMTISEHKFIAVRFGNRDAAPRKRLTRYAQAELLQASQEPWFDRREEAIERHAEEVPARRRRVDALFVERGILRRSGEVPPADPRGAGLFREGVPPGLLQGQRVLKDVQVGFRENPPAATSAALGEGRRFVDISTHLESAALLQTQIAVDTTHEDLPQHVAVRSLAEQPYEPSNDDIPFTEAEVRAVIAGVPSRTSPDPDEITPGLMRVIFEAHTPFVMHVVNAALRLVYFPRGWRRERIIFLPKPDRPPQCTSPARALVRLKERLMELKASNTPAALMALDFQGAFDSVWHPGVLRFFREHSAPGKLYHVLRTFLRD
ncbi:hypothetical protein HPB50_009344 [Hyalomma asiaticum]|uniref:Uncharacterized protein n=1 Tax=Hyalomma asiaticum TaxID=266040 RepID=A0ACB7T7N3_HYAAI|nr:hypothetical protein HPB50_009344 [Hyalomma asiaticum]